MKQNYRISILIYEFALVISLVLIPPDSPKTSPLWAPLRLTSKSQLTSPTARSASAATPSLPSLAHRHSPHLIDPLSLSPSAFCNPPALASSIRRPPPLDGFGDRFLTDAEWKTMPESATACRRDALNRAPLASWADIYIKFVFYIYSVFVSSLCLIWWPALDGISSGTMPVVALLLGTFPPIYIYFSLSFLHSTHYITLYWIACFYSVSLFLLLSRFRGPFLVDVWWKWGCRRCHLRFFLLFLTAWWKLQEIEIDCVDFNRCSCLGLGVLWFWCVLLSFD